MKKAVLPILILLVCATMQKAQSGEKPWYFAVAPAFGYTYTATDFKAVDQFPHGLTMQWSLATMIPEVNVRPYVTFILQGSGSENNSFGLEAAWLHSKSTSPWQIISDYGATYYYMRQDTVGNCGTVFTVKKRGIDVHAGIELHQLFGDKNSAWRPGFATKLQAGPIFVFEPDFEGQKSLILFIKATVLFYPI